MANNATTAEKLKTPGSFAAMQGIEEIRPAKFVIDSDEMLGGEFRDKDDYHEPRPEASLGNVYFESITNPAVAQEMYSRWVGAIDQAIQKEFHGELGNHMPTVVNLEDTMPELQDFAVEKAGEVAGQVFETTKHATEKTVIVLFEGTKRASREVLGQITGKESTGEQRPDNVTDPAVFNKKLAEKRAEQEALAVIARHRTQQEQAALEMTNNGLTVEDIKDTNHVSQDLRDEQVLDSYHVSQAIADIQRTRRLAKTGISDIADKRMAKLNSTQQDMIDRQTSGEAGSNLKAG